MNDWSLRLARPDDADVMPAIDARAITQSGNGESPAGLAGQRAIPRDLLLRCIAKGHCLVAHIDARLAGFLINQPFGRELHIWKIAVLPEFQRRGIGSGLVRACLIDARNTGFAAVTLTIFRDLPRTAPFFNGLGFEELTALDAHPRLARELAVEAKYGRPAHGRYAMIRFLG